MRPCSGPALVAVVRPRVASHVLRRDDPPSRVRPADHERARTAVRKALVRAVESIAAAEPALGEHLRASLTTGARCRYDPAAGREVSADSWAAGAPGGRGSRRSGRDAPPTIARS